MEGYIIPALSVLLIISGIAGLIITLRVVQNKERSKLSRITIFCIIIALLMAGQYTFQFVVERDLESGRQERKQHKINENISKAQQGIDAAIKQKKIDVARRKNSNAQSKYQDEFFYYEYNDARINDLTGNGRLALQAANSYLKKAGQCEQWEKNKRYCKKTLDEANKIIADNTNREIPTNNGTD